MTALDGWAFVLVHRRFGLSLLVEDRFRQFSHKEEPNGAIEYYLQMLVSASIYPDRREVSRIAW